MSDAMTVLRPTASSLGLRTRVNVSLQLHPTHATRLRADAEDNELAQPANASRRSVWALADQGVVSLGNCVTNVVLIRSLAVSEWGVFSILVEAMLFLNSLQAALVIYPLSVRGAVMNRNALRKLAGACLILTAAMALPLGIALLTAGGIVGSFPTAIFAVSALAFWQCQETLRRAMMAHGGQRRALPGDIVSYIGQAGLVLILSLTGLLTVNTAFAVMTLTSALAVIVQAFQIGPRFTRSLPEIKQISKDFWILGRWVLLGNLTLIVTTLGCSWTLFYSYGTSAVGRFQALAQLMKLSNPLTICMAGLIVPAAARAFKTEGLVAAKNVALRYGMLTACALGPYFLFLIAFPTTALHLMFRYGSEYGSMGNQLRLFVVWYSALFISQVGGCLLNAIEQSRRSFIAQGVQTLAVVFIALPLTSLYGVNGLMVGGVIANLAMAACYVSMLRRLEEPADALPLRLIKEEMQSARKAA